MLGKMIAAFRRERGMTQETLAERLGVAAQTISKWETRTTFPDVMLLPQIADALAVSIDALYGREAPRVEICQDNAVDEVLGAVRATMAGASYDPALDGSFGAALQRYTQALQRDEETRSVIQNQRDVLYFREALGALALRKPEEGWNSLFARDETAVLLQTLADPDFRKAMAVIIRKRMLTFTLPGLMKQCGLSDGAHLQQLLETSGCFVRRELVIDETPL